MASACINIELPWNPAVLEQRIGRIYRLGQRRPIDVYNLVSEPGIESRIAGVLGLTVYTSAYIAEVFRSGLQSIPKGQMEAARASGLSYWGAMFSVIIPQVLRNTIGALGNQWIGATKNTSIVLFLGVADLVFQAQEIEAATFRGVQAFTAVAIIFAVICLGESLLLNQLERRLGRKRGRTRTPLTMTQVIRTQA